MYTIRPGPSPGFSSVGSKTRWGPHFLNTVLDVCSNRWAKRELGGRAPLASPLATALHWTDRSRHLHSEFCDIRDTTGRHCFGHICVGEVLHWVHCKCNHYTLKREAMFCHVTFLNGNGWMTFGPFAATNPINLWHAETCLLLLWRLSGKLSHCIRVACFCT